MISNKTYPYEDNIPFHATKLIEGTFGAFGNILTIVAILRFKNLQTGSSFILLSIAVSDLWSALITNYVDSFQDILKSRGPEYYDEWIPSCYFMLFSGFFGGSSNINGICLTAVDRFMAIRFPIFYRNSMTLLKWKIILLIMWVLTFIKVLTETIVAMEVELRDMCSIEDTYDDDIYLFTIMLYFALVSIVTSSLYVKIGLMIYKRNKVNKSQGGVENEKTKKQQKVQMKMTKIMAMVFGKNLKL